VSSQASILSQGRTFVRSCAPSACAKGTHICHELFMEAVGRQGNVSGAERLREQDATRNPAMWERWDMARGGFRLVLSCLVSAQVVASFVPTPACSCPMSGCHAGPDMLSLRRGRGGGGARMSVHPICRRPRPLLGARMASAGGGAQGAGEGLSFRTFRSFQLLEVAAGSGELTMRQAYAAARELASRPAELTTLDMMAALGACFIASEESVQDLTLDDVWELVKDFETMLVKPNLMTCTHLLGICVKLADAGRADHRDGIAILEWAIKRGIRPDAVMVAQVMNVCARAAGHGRCNLSTLKEVVNFSESLKPPVESTVISYTSMLDALAKAVPAGQATLDDGDEVWKMMTESGIAPNCRTYSAMLTFFANFAVAQRTSTLDRAWALWTKMQADAQLFPLTGTYNAMFNCLAKNAAVTDVSLEDARKLLLLAREQRVFWDEQTLVSNFELLQRIASRRDPRTPADAPVAALEQGWWLIREAEAQGVKLTALSFSGLTAVVAKAAASGSASRAQLDLVLEAMRERKIKGDAGTYVSRMEVLAKLTGRGEASIKDGVAMLQEMRSEKVTPTTELFNVLMDICAKAAQNGAGQPQDGFGVLQWMKSFSIEPDRTTYNTLLNLLAQSARFGKVQWYYFN